MLKGQLYIPLLVCYSNKYALSLNAFPFRLINKLQPGLVKKVNESSLNWPQVTAKSATPESSWLLSMQQELGYSFK